MLNKTMLNEVKDQRNFSEAEANFYTLAAVKPATHFRTKITCKCENSIEYYNIENIGAGAETGSVF